MLSRVAGSRGYGDANWSNCTKWALSADPWVTHHQHNSQLSNKNYGCASQIKETRAPLYGHIFLFSVIFILAIAVFWS